MLLALIPALGAGLGAWFGLRGKKVETHSVLQQAKDDRAFATQAEIIEELRAENKEIRREITEIREHYEQALAQVRAERDKALDDRSVARQTAADHARRIFLLEEQVRRLGEEPQNGKRPHS